MKNVKCPKCGLTNIADIIYGYPAVEDIYKFQEESNIIFGGCCIVSYQPIYYCKNCGSKFGNEPNTAENLILIGIEHIAKLNKQLEESGGEFNIFEMFNIEHYEVSTHSLMLQKIFDYSDNKINRNAFLDFFIEILNLPPQENWKVEREKHAYIVEEDKDLGRIDFWLESKSAHLCIALEMKIYAGDQPEQLKRYAQYANYRISQPKGILKGYIDDYRIVYLTLDEHMPSKQSIGDVDPEKFISISYKNHIIKWLDRCIKFIEKADAKDKNIYSALLQYKNLCENLVKENENMELVKTLSNPDSYNALQELKKAEEKVKQKLVNDFWYELKSKLPTRFEFDIDCEPEKFYKKGGITTLTYKTNHIVKDNRKIEYNLYVYISAYNRSNTVLHYGVCLYNEQKDKFGDCSKITPEDLDKYKFRIDFFDEYDYREDLGWKKITSIKNNDEYNFNEFSEPVVAMLEDTIRNEEIEYIAEQVCALVEKINNYNA